MPSLEKTPEEIREIVLNALHQVAPEVELEKLQPNTLLRDELELDSMDFLRFISLLSKKLNIEVPERDYPKLASFQDCLEYLKHA